MGGFFFIRCLVRCAYVGLEERRGEERRGGEISRGYTFVLAYVGIKNNRVVRILFYI